MAKKITTYAVLLLCSFKILRIVKYVISKGLSLLIGVRAERTGRGAGAGAGAGASVPPSWSSSFFNTLYTPLLDPGGVPSFALTPPPISSGFTSFGDYSSVRSSGTLGTSTPGFTARSVSASSASVFNGFPSGPSGPSGPRPSSSSLYNPPPNTDKQMFLPSRVFELGTRVFSKAFKAFTTSPTDTVKFELFTRKDPTTPTRIYARKRAALEQSTFDPSKPTKILIHGFWSHQGPGSGGEAIKNAFLSVQDCNVITVDWSGADTHEYTSARSVAVPRVGNEVAELIRLLEGLGNDLNDVHIVGHSLGAHIAGAAGSQTLGPARAGRITGLDPAGPLFEGREPSKRLDPTDAGFVDVVHTDGGQLGYAAPLGHVDFFPQGGMHVQPGCGKDPVGLCSHCLALDYIIDGLLNPGSRVFRSCSSWQDYQKEVCESGANAVMGLYTDPRSRGSYYLTSDLPVRDDLKWIGGKDLLGAFSAGKDPAGRDGVQRLQC